MDCATPRGKDSKVKACAAVAALLLMAGCHHSDPPPFPKPMAGILAPTAKPGFALLLSAADAIEHEAGTLITRTDWTPGTRKAAIKAASRALGMTRSALAQGAKFAFTPVAPGQGRPPVRGWRFLARVLQFRIRDAVDRGDYQAAASDLITVHRLGLVFLGGDCGLAGLGFNIIEDAQKELWPKFPEMPAATLRNLGQGIASLQKNAPAATVTLANERVTMRKGAAWVLDGFQNERLEHVGKALGKPAGPVIRYMQELKGKSQEEQVAFFNGFIAEGDDEADWLDSVAAESVFVDSEPDDPSGERPWRRLSAALFRSGRYFLPARAKFEARMRLFALDAQLMAQFKSTGGVPGDLSRFPSWLRTDPFSGRALVYVPQGSDYRLYSIGRDGVDNGGEASASDGGADIGVGR